MAILQEIKVPLLAVNDSSLTVVELTLQQAQAVKTGDQLMVFETSKTTYEVIAEADGYIEYRAVAGNDYEVNTVVACIHDSTEAIPAVITPSASHIGPLAHSHSNSNSNPHSNSIPQLLCPSCFLVRRHPLFRCRSSPYAAAWFGAGAICRCRFCGCS